MNNFTKFISETRKNSVVKNLTLDDVSKYVDRMRKSLQRNIIDVIYLTIKYQLLDSEELDEIRTSSKSSLKKLSAKYNISEDSIIELWDMLKSLKNNIKLLPQYQTEQERNMLMSGKLVAGDLTIDLSTQSGKNAVVKMYMPMVNKIVGQYNCTSNLSRQELISAGLQGLADAINSWKKESDDGSKTVTFKTYAAYRIQQQILNDINMYSHSLSGTNWYATKTRTAAELDAISIDGMGFDGDDFDSDKLAFLGVEDQDTSSRYKEEENWKVVYKLIENQFKQRDADIFYRYFGLHGYKREKSKDIAKAFGMSEGNIRNSIINKIITYLRKDRRASEILDEIRTIYNESLMIELFGMDKQTIFETLINDDIFILLEELNKWNNKTLFVNNFNTSLSYLTPEEASTITNMLIGGFEIIDNNFKKNRKTIILFLKHMYPTESFVRKSDVSLIDYMMELHYTYNKFYNS
jgi:RNA polymerase sigma factor (sigma-70 family)